MLTWSTCRDTVSHPYLLTNGVVVRTNMGSSPGCGLLHALAEVTTTPHARAPPTRTSKALPMRMLQKLNLRRARPSTHPPAIRTRTIETPPRRMQVVDLRGAPSSIYPRTCWRRSHGRSPRRKRCCPVLARRNTGGSSPQVRRRARAGSLRAWLRACCGTHPTAGTPAAAR